MSTVLQICVSALFLPRLDLEPELLMGSLLSLFAATSKNQKWPGPDLSRLNASMEIR